MHAARTSSGGSMRRLDRVCVVPPPVVTTDCRDFLGELVRESEPCLRLLLFLTSLPPAAASRWSTSIGVLQLHTACMNSRSSTYMDGTR